MNALFKHKCERTHSEVDLNSVGSEADGEQDGLSHLLNPCFKASVNRVKGDEQTRCNISALLDTDGQI